MKQVLLENYGAAQQLKLTEADIPQPSAGEVLIKVEAIGVNYSDILRRKNTYFMPTPLPYVLGAEVVGRIEEHGNEETHLEVGQRVLAILPSGGGYSEMVTANAQYCIPLPDHIDNSAATAIFVQGSTAHLILHQIAGDISAKTVLVHAGAGGVGSILIQLAKLAGAKVIATSSSSKLEKAKSFGADAVVDYSKSGWPSKVIEANGGQKVDLILEMVGGNIYEESFHCLAQMGTMIVYGSASGKKGMVHSEHFVDESHRLLSFNLAHFIQYRMQDWQASLGAIIGLLAEGKLKIETAHSFALAEAAKAHQAIENRETTGKVVLIP